VDGVVHKLVDNRCDVRITASILWTTCGQRKPQNVIPADSCATLAEAVEILSPLETAAIRGQPWDVGKAGKPVVRAGAWHWRGGAQRLGSRATGGSDAAWPDKAPFISYMKGALLHSARPGSSRRADTPQQDNIQEELYTADRYRKGSPAADARR
jgi:hypothetical protein